MGTDAVRVIESEQYRSAAAGLLSEVEQEAIRLLLASRPFRGEPVEGIPELLALRYREHPEPLIVYYCVVSATELCLIALDGGSAPASRLPPKGRERLRGLLRDLRSMPLGIAVRELWELIKTLLS